MAQKRKRYDKQFKIAAARAVDAGTRGGARECLSDWLYQAGQFHEGREGEGWLARAAFFERTGSHISRLDGTGGFTRFRARCV